MSHEVNPDSLNHRVSTAQVFASHLILASISRSFHITLSFYPSHKVRALLNGIPFADISVAVRISSLTRQTKLKSITALGVLNKTTKGSDAALSVGKGFLGLFSRGHLAKNMHREFVRQTRAGGAGDSSAQHVSAKRKYLFLRGRQALPEARRRGQSR
jgi:hypothetical protein